jgi:hypothetical protein
LFGVDQDGELNNGGDQPSTESKSPKKAKGLSVD